MYVTIDNVTASLWEWNGAQDDDYSWTRTEVEEVVERVNRGAQLLDEENPGWREKVLPDRLDMESGSFCIIGQVYGEYDEYVGVPFGLGVGGNGGEVGEKAVEHGFLSIQDDGGIPYKLLDLVWSSLIEERANSGDDSILLRLPPPQPRNMMIQTLYDAKAIPVA